MRLLRAELEKDDRTRAAANQRARRKSVSADRGVVRAVVPTGVDAEDQVMERIMELYHNVTNGATTTREYETAGTANDDGRLETGEGAPPLRADRDRASVRMIRLTTAEDDGLAQAKALVEHYMDVDEEHRNDRSVPPRASVSMVSNCDGLPATFVQIGGKRRTIKLDTCARYSIAGVAWTKLGERLRRRPPATEMEGISGVSLPVLGLWRFKMTTMYGHEMTIDACVVDGFGDEFLLGEDFMTAQRARIDFSTNEMTYDEDGRKVILPFRTFESGRVTTYRAVARTASRWKADT